MIKSMTGYGRAQEIIGGMDILVELRSVNHRYYEFSSRLPRMCGFLDEKLKSMLQGSISRGKVEANVSINYSEGKEAVIAVNKSIAKGYIEALNEANNELGLHNDLSLSQLLKLPDVFNVQKSVQDGDEIWEAVQSVAKLALESFMLMREAEGGKMFEDISKKLDAVEDMLRYIEKKAPLISESYRNRLYSKLCDVLEDKGIDEQRIITEAAIFSERVAVDEETVRLGSHIDQFRDLLSQNVPVGRKLDFLIQEMNREVNTIGSKSQDIEITRVVVDLKSEIEKIREQVQNVE